MRLEELLRGLENFSLNGPADFEVTGVTYDSRRVRPGNLFVAVPGFAHDGTDYIPEAISRGAAAVVLEKENVIPETVTKIFVPSTRSALALLASYYHHFPSHRLKIVGITGTKGKTTTSYLVEAIFKRAGFKTGVIGTVEARIGDEIIPARLTTPESSDLQGYLKRMVEKEVSHVVMEVTSHALALDRVRGTAFDLAIFTNLSHDHLDFHKTPEEYLAAKLRLFEELGGGVKPETAGIVNMDDPAGPSFVAKTRGRVVTYGIADGRDVTVKDLYNIGLAHIAFNLVTPAGATLLETSLIGTFNVYNILAAVAAGVSMGVELSLIKEAIESIHAVPGRFEVINVGQPYLVIVDFAHSPDSLLKLLSTVKLSVKGRIILVFGAAGESDEKKRPLMGQIAKKYSDFFVITTDNPKNEDPEKIIDAIEAGALGEGAVEGRDYLKIEGRRTAIRKALESARENDAVIIAGRGHELYQDFKGIKMEFDDREVAREILKDR